MDTAAVVAAIGQADHTVVVAVEVTPQTGVAEAEQAFAVAEQQAAFEHLVYWR